MIRQVIRTRFVDDVNNFEYTFEAIENSIEIQKTENGYTVYYAIYDVYPPDPREWDNLGTMVCEHKRYNFPYEENFNSIDELIKHIKKENVIALRIYLYDHNGLCVQTTPFSCPWDSAQIGFIFCTEEQLKKEGITKEQAIEVMENEVKTYNDYIQGNVYCIVRETYNQDKEQIDYGIVGDCYDYDHVLEEIKRQAD